MKSVRSPKADLTLEVGDVRSYHSATDTACISVINLSGLASDEAREDFINRLQMTLFGWVKKHPSPHGLLYVMLSSP
jgi:hypothetical protein